MAANLQLAKQLLSTWLSIGLIVLATAGNSMAQDKEGNIAVYYLSPRILTRTNMAPDRLKRDVYRMMNTNLPAGKIGALLTKIQSTKHEQTDGIASKYDFRLCLSSGGDPIWVSGDAKIGYSKDGTFLLTAQETIDVLKIFKSLDSITGTQGKRR